MKTSQTTRFDGVVVHKIATDKGIVSWYEDDWGFWDVLLTKFGRVRVLDKNIHLTTQTDKQLKGIVRDFLKL